MGPPDSCSWSLAGVLAGNQGGSLVEKNKVLTNVPGSLSFVGHKTLIGSSPLEKEKNVEKNS